MQIRIFETSNCWRADPVQLSGTPPNGVGATPKDALANLVLRLQAISPDGPDCGYLRQMSRFGWPMLEINDTQSSGVPGVGCGQDGREGDEPRRQEEMPPETDAGGSRTQGESRGGGVMPAAPAGRTTCGEV
jgi:hypothetical protein